MSDKLLGSLSNVLVALIVAFASLVGVYIGQQQERDAQQQAREAHKQEMDVKMVEIAVGILQTEPETIGPAPRKWAVKIINKHALLPLDAEASDALIEHKIGPTGGVGATGIGTGAIGAGPIGAGPVGR